MEKLIVIKIGSAMLFKNQVPRDHIEALNSTLAEFHDYQKIIVISGSIEFGASLVNFNKISLGALACIGQIQLYKHYEAYLNKFNYRTAQCLITQDNLKIPNFIKNIKNVLEDLLRHNYIPLVNTNDLIVNNQEHLDDNIKLTERIAEIFQVKHIHTFEVNN